MTTLIREAKQCYYIKLNNKLSYPNLGSKKWWSYIKSTLNKNYFRSIPSLIEGDHVISDALQKANLFNQYFVNQAKINDTDHLLPFLRQNSNFNGATLTIIQTTEQEVSDLLSKVTMVLEIKFLNFHVLLVTLVCKNKYRAPSRCIHDPTFRHSSLVSSSGVI